MSFQPHLQAPWLVLVLGVALWGWAIWAYARTRTPIGPLLRRSLLALRLTASLLLVLMIGGLTLSAERSSEQRPRLRVLVDASASMARPLAGDGEGSSRYERALALLGETESRWGDRLEIEALAFGDGLLPGAPPPAATAPLTDLGAALGALPPAGAGEALLVLSDGEDTEGGLWGSRLGADRVVHTLMLGDSLAPADLRLDRIEAAGVLRKGSLLPLAATLVAEGDAPRRGVCRVSEDGRVLAERAWSLEPGERSRRLEFNLELEGLGQHLLDVSLDAGEPDAAPENDRRLHALRVVESRLRILALAGRPDWDLSALVQALRGEEALELVLVTPGPEGQPRRTDNGAPWDPATEPVHGLLLHSWHPSWPPDLLERLPLRGGALLLAGFLAEPGRARLPGDWRLPLAAAPLSAREASLSWGEDAARHPALQGALVAGPQPAEQPALESVSVNPLRDGRVLLRSDAEPVLTARELGGRRLAVCSGRGLWRWALHGEGGDLLVAEIFSGLLRWLAREDPPERLLVDWGDAVLASRPTPLSAEVFDEDFAPLPGADLEWRVERRDTLIATGRFGPEGPEGYRATLPALPAGVHGLRVEARLASGERLERELELPVLAPRRELSRLAAQPETLRWLAARSGGRFLLDGELASLESALDFTARVTRSRSTLRVWQHPLAFLLFLTLLGLEWGLRKRAGMI